MLHARYAPHAPARLRACASYLAGGTTTYCTRLCAGAPFVRGHPSKVAGYVPVAALGVPLPCPPTPCRYHALLHHAATMPRAVSLLLLTLNYSTQPEEPPSPTGNPNPDSQP